MKIIKDVLPVTLFAIVIIVLGYFIISTGDRNETNQNTIKKIESEKDVLKSNVAGLEIEVKKNKIIVKKIQTEKDSIAEAWNLDKVNNAKIVNSLQNRLKIKRKVRIIYKDKEIKETDSQGRLFNFGTNAYFSLLNYRSEDLKERIKNKSIISGLEFSLNGYKTINLKSEKIIGIQDIHIKKLNKRNKKVIIIAALTVIGIFVFK